MPITKYKHKKLPPIPIFEWISLATGIGIFAVVEVVLFFEGFTSLLLNSAAALIIASVSSWGIFAVQNKLKRIASALKKIVDAITIAIVFVLSIPLGMAKAIVLILKAIPKMLRGIASLLLAIPKYLPNAIHYLGIPLLNLAMIPVLAVYLTIYGLIFSLSGSTAKIMLRHYDALGHRIISPIEKYLFLELIINLIVLGIVGTISLLVLDSFGTASFITASNAANFTESGAVLSTTATLASYSAVFLIVITIAIVILLLKFFRMGASAFAAASA